MRRTAILAAVAAAVVVIVTAGVGSGSFVPGDDDGGAPGGDARPALLDEDFSGSRLRSSIWSTCHWWSARGCTLQGNNELEWYLPEQVRVSGGVARLVAERRPVRGLDGRTFAYRSGMISTGPPQGSSRPGFAFRYGRAEMRARLPTGRGLWPAFWLLPADKESKPEIDVMEAIGQRPGMISMHLHPGRDVKPLGKQVRDPALRGGWHTYAVDWRPERLIWLVDGVERWRVEGSQVPSEPMYLIANLAVGGDYPGPPGARTRFPSALEIDYIRVRE